MEKSQVAALTLLGTALALIFWPGENLFETHTNPEPSFEGVVSFKERGRARTLKIPPFRARSIGHAREKLLDAAHKLVGSTPLTRIRVARA